MYVVKAVGRFLVATAAGAGLGAGAALYRKHLLNEAPATGGAQQWQDHSGPVHVPEPGAAPADAQAPAPAAQPIPVSSQDVAALQASVADLEAARARLRERAAALRAEMEESSR